MSTPRNVSCSGTLSTDGAATFRVRLESELRDSRFNLVDIRSTFQEATVAVGEFRNMTLPSQTYSAVYAGELVVGYIAIDRINPSPQGSVLTAGQRSWTEAATLLLRGVDYTRTYWGPTQPINAVLPAGRAWQGANSRIWWWDGSQWLLASLFAGPWRWESGPGPGFSTLTQGQSYTLISEAVDNYIGTEWV